MTHQTVCETQTCTLNYQTKSFLVLDFSPPETVDREDDPRNKGLDCQTFKNVIYSRYMTI